MITKADIKKKMRELRPRISDKSIITYFTCVHNIGKYLTGEQLSHKIEDFEFLLDVEGVLGYFADKGFTQSTQRTKLGQIISVFEAWNALNDYEFSEVQDEYGEVLETLIMEKQHQLETRPQQASVRQSKNWVSWTDIQKIHDGLKKKMDYFGLPKEGMDYDERQLYDDYVILSLYVADEDNPPLRNDYALMRVIDGEDEDDGEHNYLVNDENMRFLLNDYKTKKTYGKQVIKVGEKLRPILNDYLHYNNTGFLINDKTGNPISANVLTQRLVKIFKGETGGKKVSTQLLRHSFITHHLPPEERKRKKLAEKMLHSPQMNIQYSLYVE
jgi:hypothetical protein